MLGASFACSFRCNLFYIKKNMRSRPYRCRPSTSSRSRSTWVTLLVSHASPLKAARSRWVLGAAGVCIHLSTSLYIQAGTQHDGTFSMAYDCSFFVTVVWVKENQVYNVLSVLFSLPYSYRNSTPPVRPLALGFLLRLNNGERKTYWRINGLFQMFFAFLLTQNPDTTPSVWPMTVGFSFLLFEWRSIKYIYEK